MANTKKPAGAAKAPKPPAAKSAKNAKTHPATDRAGDDWRKTAAVRVRMYRHGLGDCFLLTFPSASGKDFKILIDCGVILGTPKGADLIREVVANLQAETAEGGTPTIAVLVATHEHWDHLSAFADAREAFDKFEIGQVWMAWTEDPANEEANELRKDRAKKLKALQLGVAHLRAELTATGALGADGHSGAAAADFRRAAEVLTFFGIDPDEPPDSSDGGPGVAGKAAKLGITDAMDWCRKPRDAEPKFWQPGDLIEPKEVKGLRVYVLGPPTDRKQLFKALPTKSGHETYGADEANQHAVALAFFGADVKLHDADEASAEFDGAAPFDRKYRIGMEQAADTDFFRDHYFGTGAGDAEDWRRIDGTALAGAAEFALQLDSDTNNTSLALAFELPDGRILLFAADAQVGNWESWHADSDGKGRVWDAGGKQVTAKDLLGRTVLYKVGHHGSHNATLRDKGLEMMTEERLVALVPVDTHIAHDKKHWDKMPFDPLMASLRKHTSGRVIVADQPVADLPAGTFPAGRAVDSSALIDVDGPGGKTIRRPLYVDYFVPKS
jgi:hypothetical protein